MIMPAGKPLLLPANPRFIALTLVLALLLQMWVNLWGQRWMPDLMQAVLAFWLVYQPRRVGLILAFVLGLLMDVHEAALLGQNALAYVVMAFVAGLLHRRVLWFPLREQPLQVAPMFVLVAVIEWIARLWHSGMWPHWSQLLAPVLQTALWPLVAALLLTPQRRPYERNDIRPL